MLHQALILEDGGIIVNPSTIRSSRQNFRVHVLPLDHGPVGQDLVGPALAAKGLPKPAGCRNHTGGGKWQGCPHGGEKHGAMEGADLQEEPWQQAKVVHGPQEPQL